MGNRVVYGHTNSSNGWPMVDQAGCTWVEIPGTNPTVKIQVQSGQPQAILRAFVADINAYVEHVRDADTACYTATNSVDTSNHLSATAVDVDWDLHPFRVANAGFNSAQIATIREMLDFYEGTVFWGNDWSNPKDAMHFQLGSRANGGNIDTYNNPHTADFIARKIRADGYSTFRRGGTAPPPPAPPANNAADVLARATGITLAKATAVLPLVSFALVKGNCTNPRRIAAALAQWVVESGHFVYTEEIADGPESDERWKYKGRTWIQLTWLENYAGFSKWCNGLGLVPTPDYFVVHPHELAEQKWAALGPAYWWAIKYPRINEYADRGDIDNVSKWVNAPAWVDNPSKHANGEKARRDAYNLALALGDQLLTLTSPASPDQGDDMAQVPQDQWDRVYRELTQRLPSRSPLRYLDQAAHYKDGLVDTWAGLTMNLDGMTHVQFVEVLAGYNHPPTMALLTELANGDPAKYPDRADDIKLAQAILNRVATNKLKAAAPASPGGPAVVNNTTALSRNDVQQIAAAAADAVSAQQQSAPLTVQTSGTKGQLFGNALDALDALQSVLTPQGKATVVALIGALQTEEVSA